MNKKTFKKEPFMKKINILTLSIMALNITLGACEFTITNDSDYNKIYISMNANLADVVSEQTLINSTSTDEEEKGEIKKAKDKIIKKDFAIFKNSKGTTPFTKQFDVYIPLKSNGQYERRYRVHMKYCDGKPSNCMTISEIKNKKINMNRFDVCDYSIKHEAGKAGQFCKPHAPTFEHKHEYEAKREKELQLNEATEQEIKNPGYLLENPFLYKEILP